MRFFALVGHLVLYNVCLAYDIAIVQPATNSTSTIAGFALNDFEHLLQQACECNIVDISTSADVIFEIPEVEHVDDVYFVSKSAAKNYPVYGYPEQDYTWLKTEVENQSVFSLTTKNDIGLANALYGFLQEQLGFSFYHPRESKIPDISEWPAINFKIWKADPRFTIKGFHLHTQHPLELTEPLHNPHFPDGDQMIKEYVDWLARNGQNYFEFNLLESVELKTWIPYMRRLVDYMHSRGIVAGVDLSLHMIQQKSFMLYKSPPASFRSKEVQIKRNVELLSQVGFDVWNMEFNTAEFVQGDLEEKTKLRLFIIDLLKDYDIRLMGREHVVKLEESVGAMKEVVQLSPEQYEIDKYRGVLIHTVMFYTIFEEKAPVYQNDNLRHMLEMMKHEQGQRETWYYPESAYWITFDNSIPMLLLPYLSARLADIELMDSLNIPGHVTFSSGWEWGYWAIDWSIAKWSWEHTIDGDLRNNVPLEITEALNFNDNVQSYLEASLRNQEEYLKDKLLMKYLTAQSPTDELPGPLNLEFHPRPPWAYKYLRNEAPLDSIKVLLEKTIPLLQSFVDKQNKLFDELIDAETNYSNIELELIDAVRMVCLRAEHRLNTLTYLTSIRLEKLNVETVDGSTAINQAGEIRTNALNIVRRREGYYRYDLNLLSGQYSSHTAYDFGYLFPTHNLHFWEREEQQAINNKWSVRYRNIWDLLRIIGIKN